MSHESVLSATGVAVPRQVRESGWELKGWGDQVGGIREGGKDDMV